MILDGDSSARYPYVRLSQTRPFALCRFPQQNVHVSAVKVAETPRRRHQVAGFGCKTRPLKSRTKVKQRLAQRGLHNAVCLQKPCIAVPLAGE